MVFRRCRLLVPSHWNVATAWGAGINLHGLVASLLNPLVLDRLDGVSQACTSGRTGAELASKHAKREGSRGPCARTTS